MNETTNQQANLAETLSKILPDAKLLATHQTGVPSLIKLHAAVPKGFELKDIEVDLEKHLANPRQTFANAAMSDDDSFLAYVKRHAKPETVVWCKFDPQNYQLSFLAVIDEHAHGTPGWRRHTASFTPMSSNEWKVWTGLNKKPMAQVEFAEFLERQELDIAAKEGRPTSAQMMQMATNFEMTSEKRLRSATRLQDGGVRLEYIDDQNAETVQQMSIFERFAIGIPVFWSGAGYLIEARLKYRNNGGKVSFHYELIRPDRSHEDAAKELIAKVRAGIGDVPLLMGTGGGRGHE
jgi:uncharacterized protein YfdQ (DUF2303 family)